MCVCVCVCVFFMHLCTYTLLDVCVIRADVTRCFSCFYRGGATFGQPVNNIYPSVTSSGLFLDTLSHRQDTVHLWKVKRLQLKYFHMILNWMTANFSRLTEIIPNRLFSLSHHFIEFSSSRLI